MNVFIDLIAALSLSASHEAFAFQDSSAVFNLAEIVITGGVIAFFMEIAEFGVITYGSSLTLSIVGVVKVTIIIKSWGTTKFYPFIISGNLHIARRPLS